MKFTLRGASGVAILAGLAGALPAWSQQTATTVTVDVSGPQQAVSAPQSAPAETSQTANKPAADKVIVTGSYIAGAAETAALPVDAFAADELKERGNPSIVQLVKTIPSSGSAVGESNRYAGGAGTATINLRGFGAARSLVLMNGQRIADNPTGVGGVDLNFIPQAAVGRIEVLKDGAAATYGSDAVGGVINFITRKDLEGFNVETEYAAVAGSDGEYLVNAAYGKQFDNGNILFTAGYRHRSPLEIHERSWAVGDFASVGGYGGAGGFSGAANPGIYNPNGATAATRAPSFRDNGCTELGGTLSNTVSLPNPLFGLKPGQAANVSVPVPVNANSPQAASSVCRYQFSNFNDLVNKEDHYQLYAEANFDLSDNLRFHGEAAWNRNDVPNQRISPANLSTQFPTPTSLGGLSGSLATPGAQNFFVPYNVPAYAPGLVDLRTTCAAPLTAAQCTAAGGAGGVDISQTNWRAFAFAGRPLNPDGADRQSIEQTEFRVSGGFSGRFFDAINFNTNATFSENTGIVSTNDLLVDRIQLALNGWGSTDTDPTSCTPAERTIANAGNAAVGCYFFNPFTNGLQAANPSYAGGGTNPYYRGAANPAVVNDPHALAWLYGNYINTSVNQLVVGEAVLSGELPVFKLPGGEIGWAAGAQWRYDRSTVNYGDFNNYQTYPCVDSIDVGVNHPACQAPAGPIQFFGSNANTDTDRSVSAVFGEMKFPILDTLEADLAVRYENYGGGIGGNTSPKLSARWQVLEWIALRGSVSKTFRAPTSNLITNSCATGVANIGGQYRAVRTCGNPALQPEEADSYNVGAIFELGGFSATLDYFHINFKGELTTEGSSGLFAAMFPTATGNCGVAGYEALQARFAFANNTCLSSNVLRVDSNNVNGPDTETAGFDFKANYTWNDAVIQGLDARFGVDATLLSIYKRGAFTLLGAPQVRFREPENRAGLYDLTSAFFSYPRLRGTMFASGTMGDVTARLQIRYVEGTEPAFGTTFFKQVADSSQPSGYRLVAPGKTDDFWQPDLIVTYRAPWDLTITGSIENLFDKDPPTAFSNYNYDYTSGNPLGRVFKINLRKTF